jgi:3-hydroxybutyryl-CoA dehydrogenase
VELRNVAVIGAGTMGVGVTHAYIAHGMNVVLVDNDERALEAAHDALARDLRLAPMIDKTLPRVDIDEALARVKRTKVLADVEGVDFVVENVTEKWEIKEPIYAALDEICRPDVCFAANTSCISITRIGSVTKRPDRIMGMHFMNPVYGKATVEMVRGLHTSEAALDVGKAALAKIGKRAVVVNDYPGFVSNRVLMLTINEAAFVVQDGVAPPADVDRIFRECFGHKMGPLETADLIGLDTILFSVEALYEAYADSKYRPCPLLKKMVAGGLLGRKSGRGFHDYTQ